MLLFFVLFVVVMLEPGLVSRISWSRFERPWEQDCSKTSLALDVDLQSRGLGSSHALTTSWSLANYWPRV